MPLQHTTGARQDITFGSLKKYYRKKRKQFREVEEEDKKHIFLIWCGWNLTYTKGDLFGLKNNNRGISAKTFTYKMEINLRFEESGRKARPIPLPMSKKLFENLYLDGKFSDIKIFCEDKIFYCHKVILSSQSEVFRSMLTNVDMVEASSGEIKIVDFAANVMETLLYYLYNFDHQKSPGM